MAACVIVARDGLGNAAVELIKRAKQARRHQFHQAPCIGQLVFNWRSGHGQGLCGLQLFGGLEPGGLGVFEHLRFIMDDEAEAMFFECLDIADQQRIAGQDHVLRADLRAECFAVGAMPEQHRQAWARTVPVRPANWAAPMSGRQSEPDA